MKKINVEDAVGMTLCHDITAMRDGFKGAAFKRGHVLREEDIPELLDIGKKTVYIWEEHAGEIHEEDAALRMAQMAQVPGAHYTGPSEGKMLLLSDIRGMFRVNTPLLERINSIGDITISCIPDHYPVEPGARLASMRIVPLVTQETQIEEAEQLCIKERLFDLLPYQERKVGVIITGSEVYAGRIQDKFEPVVREKLKAYPAQILGVSICDDDLGMITEAAQGYLEQGADFLIFTGGMSVDPDDLTPTAILKLGAEIITHGLPAQPGNMTLVAYLEQNTGSTDKSLCSEPEDCDGTDTACSEPEDCDGTDTACGGPEEHDGTDTTENCTCTETPVTILGIPGASISLPTTMFDVLLPQVFAGVRFTKQELIRLGEGGLCQMCPACHFPNCTFGRY